MFEIGRIQKVNPKGTQQKSELQKRTNLYSKKKTSEKNGTQINGSSRLIPNFITWGFGSVVPRSGNQLNSSSVEETCVALDRCIHLPGWWGTHLPKNGWVFQKWWALEKAQTGIRFCLGHFLGYICDFFSGVSTCFGTDKLQQKWKPSAIFNLMFFGVFHLLWEKFLRNFPKPRKHDIQRSHAPQYGPCV